MTYIKQEIVITETDLQVLRERLIDNLTLDQIAEKHGVSRQRIHQRLTKKFGVYASERKPKVTDLDKVLKHLPEYEQKESGE